MSSRSIKKNTRCIFIFGESIYCWKISQYSFCQTRKVMRREERLGASSFRIIDDDINENYPELNDYEVEAVRDETIDYALYLMREENLIEEDAVHEAMEFVSNNINNILPMEEESRTYSGSTVNVPFGEEKGSLLDLRNIVREALQISAPEKVRDFDMGNINIPDAIILIENIKSGVQSFVEKREEKKEKKERKKRRKIERVSARSERKGSSRLSTVEPPEEMKEKVSSKFKELGFKELSENVKTGQEEYTLGESSLIGTAAELSSKEGKRTEMTRRMRRTEKDFVGDFVPGSRLSERN